jgi:hypothetical protein
MGTKRLDADMRWVTFLGQQSQNYQKIPEVVASSSELEFLRWISLLPDSAGSFFSLETPQEKKGHHLWVLPLLAGKTALLASVCKVSYVMCGQKPP